MRLEVYCEAAPIKDRYQGQGLLRALVPILAAIDAETVRLYNFPIQRRIRREMVVDHFQGRIRLIHSVFAKIVGRLDRIAPAFSAWLFGLFCRIAFGRARDADTFFAVLGANHHSLFRAREFAHARGLPFALYIVDDLVEPHRIGGGEADPALLARIAAVLREAVAVICISDNLAGRIEEYFGVPAIGLNLPYIEQESPPEAPEEPQLIFIGSANFLYASALRRTIDAVTELNARSDGPPVRILLTSPPEAVLAEVGPVPDFVELKSFGDRGELLRAIAASRAAILPYSFELEHRPMVESSFPSKMLDYLEAARDILLVAPPYSSAARYFEGIEGIAPLSEPAEIQARILSPADPALRPVLRRLLRERHSTQAYRQVIADAIARGKAA